jgi:hypothetical protein
MTGEIRTPPTRHSCAPGWSQRQVSPNARCLPPGVTSVLVPPTRGAFPVGAIWKCGGCGQLWIVRPYLSARYGHAHFLVRFRPVGRLERWLRRLDQ